jgi:hypothetical protein
LALLNRVLKIHIAVCLAAVVGGTPVTSSGAPQEETTQYVVKLAARDKYKAGEPGFVEVVIVPKQGYKINDKYPTKFTADSAPSGVVIPKAVLKVGDGVFSERRGVLKLKIIPSKPGAVKVGGNASFSVCSESACIIGKKHLDVSLQVI